jgi:RNase H-fold protein (predicted Holliday junction resolvase)
VTDKELTKPKPLGALTFKTGQTSQFYPKTKYEFAENIDFYTQLGKIIDVYKVKGIIIGLPIHKPEAIKHATFIEGITKYMHRESLIKVPTTFINEELTTIQAKRVLEAHQVNQRNYDKNYSQNKKVEMYLI